MSAAVIPQLNALPTVRAGFIPLVDCAPLIIAKLLGFDADEGLSLSLHREVSWANIRDKAEAGVLDCAIMLAPLPLASTLGAGGRDAVPMIAAMATSLNGNAITVTRALHEAMLNEDPVAANAGGMAPASSLARVITRRRKQNLPPLTFGMVYPFSCHNYDLRYWLAAAGIDPDNDINLLVVPPPLIAGRLKSGRIDGFCVGEPWSSVAVAQGDGVIIATKSELWPASPEKVLGLRLTFAEKNADLTHRLIRALQRACDWLDEPQNRPVAAEALSDPRFVGVPKDILLRTLTDNLERGTGIAGPSTSNTIIFSKGGANFPWVSHAMWLLTQIIRWGQVTAPFDISTVSRQVYRPNLYRAAVADLGIALPPVDTKSEGGGAFFGSATFSPDAPIDYLGGLTPRTGAIDITRFTSTVRQD